MKKKIALVKPKRQRVLPDMLDYHDMIEYIEQKYNIKTRGYGRRKEDHFDRYQRLTGDKMPFGSNKYPYSLDGQLMSYRDGKRVPVTKEEYDADFELIHEHYARYQEWCKQNPEPPYLDYWHWLLEHCFSEMANPSHQVIPVREILDVEDWAPEWVKQITLFIQKEFHHDIDDEGCLDVWVSW